MSYLEPPDDYSRLERFEEEVAEMDDNEVLAMCLDRKWISQAEMNRYRDRLAHDLAEEEPEPPEPEKDE